MAQWSKAQLRSALRRFAADPSSIGGIGRIALYYEGWIAAIRGDDRITPAGQAVLKKAVA